MGDADVERVDGGAGHRVTYNINKSFQTVPLYKNIAAFEVLCNELGDCTLMNHPGRLPEAEETVYTRPGTSWVYTAGLGCLDCGRVRLSMR